MICPVCKAEYRDGFYKCAECDVALVSEHDDEAIDGYESTEHGDLLSVLETTDSIQLSEVVLMIEEQKIPYLVQSGTALSTHELSAALDLAWHAVLYVPESYLEQVQAIINEVKSGSGESHGSPPETE